MNTHDNDMHPDGMHSDGAGDKGGLTPEERALAERLARLGARGGEPSPALDARILAAAQAAVHPAAARPRRRWPLPLGIAASLVLAVGIAWRLRPLPEPVVYDETASAAAESAPAPTAGAPASAPSAQVAAPADLAATDQPTAPTPEQAEPAPIAEAGRASRERRAEAVAAPEPVPPQAFALPAPVESPVLLDAPAPPAPPPLPAPPAPAQDAFAPAAAPGETARAQARDVQAQRQPSAQRKAIALPETAPGEPDIDYAEPDEEVVPPATADNPAVREAWLQRIRELIAAGRIDDARASLREFRHRYPGVVLPDDLRALGE